MITKLEIKDVASYDGNGICMDLLYSNQAGLSEVIKTNFIYGMNGVGKSTIVKFLRSIKARKDSGNLDVSSPVINGLNDFEKCTLSFNGNFDEDILIFDEKFIEDSFELNKKVPAIFPNMINNTKSKALIVRYEHYLSEIQLDESLNHISESSKIEIENTRVLRDYLAMNETYMPNEINNLPDSKFKQLCQCEYSLFNSDKPKDEIAIEDIRQLEEMYEYMKTTDEYHNIAKLRMTIDKNLDVLRKTPEFWYRCISFSFVYIFICGNPNKEKEHPKKWCDFINQWSNDEFRYLLFLYDRSRKNSISKKIYDLKWSLAKTGEIIKNINTLLENSGLSGFEIREEKNEGHVNFYIHRDNMSIKKVWYSLSEGEKHFIAFLYFYQLCIHKIDIDNPSCSNSKIIIIDDPITSMDSNSMFQVATIIRELVTNYTQNQYFIFTHNHYFYNEITYKINDSDERVANWLIQKDSLTRFSSIQKGFKMLNDYASLWKMVKEIKAQIDITPTNHQYNIVLANLFRRILETYAIFSNIGNSPWNTINTRDIIKASFVSWINKDSHAILPNSELFYQSVTDTTPQDLFKVFKSIFIQPPIKDEPHYNRWMNG